MIESLKACAREALAVLTARIRAAWDALVQRIRDRIGQ
jgi:hypothetical protein